MSFEEIKKRIEIAWGIAENECDNVDFIRNRTKESENLCQLAEEASELAQAALKLRRTNIKDNPTPQTNESALANLIEEIADVLACVDVFIGNEEELYQEINRIKIWKLKRWKERMKNSNK